MQNKKLYLHIYLNILFLAFMEYSILSIGIFKLKYKKGFHWQQHCFRTQMGHL